MGCGGDREKQVAKEHQWGYFNLSDFKSNSCWAPFSYAILYITLIVSITCYVLDILTCSQLIISDRWAGQIKISPLVPFEIARWIFTGCILLSFAFLAYRWYTAIRAIRSGSVVASYMDPLAVRVQSIRMGQAQGWRRFLVFAELTKSKKGAEYVALFSYFSFEAALRILFAEGPRQVINGITIYSIMRSEIIPIDGNAPTLGHSPIVQFFLNVKALGEGNTLRIVVFFGMLFTLIVWIIAFLSLLCACILYIMFLWHHIPSGAGGLGGYCKSKVDGKLQSIVDKKIKKAFEREEKMRQKEEAKAIQSGQSIPSIKKQPTLPVLAMGEGDKLPEMPMVSRANTFTTLPEYESRAGTPSSQARSDNFSRPGMPSRSTTLASNQTFASSNASLIGAAAPMGYSQPPRARSPAESMASRQPPLGRSLTGQSNASQESSPYDQRVNEYQTRPFGPPSRQNTGGNQFGPNRQYGPAQSMRSNSPSEETGFEGEKQFGPDRRFGPAPSLRSDSPFGQPGSVNDTQFRPAPSLRSDSPFGQPGSVNDTQFRPDRQHNPATSMRSNTPMGDPRFGGPNRPGPDRSYSPAPSFRSNPPRNQAQYPPGPRRQNTNGSNNGSYFAGSDRSDAGSVMSAGSSYGRRPAGPPSSRSPSEQGGIEMQNRSFAPPLASQLRPYSPALSPPGQGPRIPFAGPGRNLTPEPGHASSESFDRPNGPVRSGTAPPRHQFSRPGNDSFSERPSPPSRAATDGPSYQEWPQHGL